MKNVSLTFPVRPFSTRGGAKVPHRKNTAAMETVVMPAPKEVIIPMSQHIGAPCNVIVRPGDHVDVGQSIGENDSFVTAPIHASVSGTVKKIIDLKMPNGSKVKAVVIESDGKMTKSPYAVPPAAETKEQLLLAIKRSGLVGLGGAGFPAHVKLSIPQNKKIDTLIINGAECEPYITSDHREILENSWDILSGIKIVKDLLDVHRVIIGIESNKPDAIKVLSQIADNEAADPDDEVRILTLKSSYPQGAEKVLIRACTGRKVPAGKLPADVGCVVMNVTSVAFIAKYLKTGIPLVSKRITVDGSAIKEPKNVIVPLGTPIKDVIEFCGGYKCEPKKILMGGPMMGIALTDDSMPVLKQNNAILAFDENDAKLAEETDCIRCGKCLKSCPMSLMPEAIAGCVKLKDVKGLEKLNVMTCMECGSCAFNCPAHKHLVQTIREGKAMVRAEAMKKAEEQKKEEAKKNEQ
ncbi:MAG: electron transport complex subunit RsxC [Acutalibacteraceae bacterium]|nr:electron transport complex subunit RsxC [Acutalibacteraceae bacterium]